MKAQDLPWAEAMVKQIVSAFLEVWDSKFRRAKKLFGGWISSRDTAGDVHERDPNEPCSGATGRVQNPFCTRSAKSQAIHSPPNSF